MKTEQTSTGWIETTSTKFDVVLIKTKFQVIQDWVEFNIKNTKITANRLSCGRCKKKWSDFEDKTQYLALAQIKGQLNRTICQQCVSEITGAAKI